MKIHEWMHFYINLPKLRFLRSVALVPDPLSFTLPGDVQKGRRPVCWECERDLLQINRNDSAVGTWPKLQQ